MDCCRLCRQYESCKFFNFTLYDEDVSVLYTKPRVLKISADLFDSNRNVFVSHPIDVVANARHHDSAAEWYIFTSYYTLGAGKTERPCGAHWRVPNDSRRKKSPVPSDLASTTADGILIDDVRKPSVEA